MAAESWLTSNLIKEALQREWGSNRNQEAKERSQGSLGFVNLGYGIFMMELLKAGFKPDTTVLHVYNNKGIFAKYFWTFLFSALPLTKQQ